MFLSIHVRVENHRPVPLEPLSRLTRGHVSALFYMEEDGEGGWHDYDSTTGLCVPLGEPQKARKLDARAVAMVKARLLQPGERVVVEYAMD